MSNQLLNGLVPYPRKVQKTSGVFHLTAGMKTVIGKSAARNYDFWLGKLDLVSPEKRELNADCDAILIGDVKGSALLPASYQEKEAYRIEISEDGIAITANSEAGLSFALRTLVKIKKLNNPIHCMVIEDAPMVDMRAIHMCIFDPQDGTKKDDTTPDVVKKRIELCALLGYNYVFIEFWGMFPYERHPYACWAHSNYTKEKIEEIINFCIRDLHITPCPCQNLTSHAGWSRITTRRHVVLDQKPEMADMYIPGGWCFATENPKTKQFLKDVIDELVDAFHNPPMFHMSCDKTFGFGSTEEDRTKSANVLFAQHIANLNTYIAAKGIRPVMWADMLYTSMDSLTFKCAPFVADVLPKNILMNIWTHNDPGEYWHDVDFFEDKGYETVYSPFINYDSIQNMIKLCIKKKSKGIVQTTWYAPEGAKPYFTYSIAKQWNFDAEIGEETISAFLDAFSKE